MPDARPDTAQADLAVRCFVPPDEAGRELFLRVAECPAEIVENPSSPSLADYYGLLVRTFESSELEPLGRLASEIGGNGDRDAQARYLCIVLRDPGADRRIVSGAYASVQDGILALRFAVTEQSYRGTGISREVLRVLLAEARRWSAARGQTLWALFGECREDSEPFFNQAMGMRRLYVPQSDGVPAEIHYELPHLGDWTPDGAPREPEEPPRREHLQLAAAGCEGRMRRETVERILNRVWRQWYVHPEREFSDRAAWERHKHSVMEHALRRRILAPLAACDELLMLSREERQARGESVRMTTDPRQ